MNKLNNNTFIKGLMFVLLLISLLIFDYIVFFHTLKLVFNYNNKELLNIISPFTTIVGIIITGYVAIYVMQKNHKFDIKNLKMEREIQDIRSQREVDYLLSEISIFAYGYGKKITKTLDIQKLTIEHIRKELLYIENSCKQIRNIKFYEINDRKIDNMHLIDEIMRNVKNADIDLIQKGFSVDANLLGEKFRKIYNLIYDHIETSEFVEFKDERFN